MITGSRAVWEVCGAPRVEECQDVPAGTRCWVCAGETTRAAVREEWQGASFTGQNRVRCPESNWVCEACLHVMSRIAPVPGRPPAPGKKFGGNFRNYSHLWEAGGFYANASKGEKPKILEFLRREHRSDWFAAIADSGQKHVLPWVPVNPSAARRGLVLFEEQVVTLPAGDPGWKLVDDMVALLTAGATKDELGTGSYTPWTWQRCPEVVRTFEEEWGGKRGGAWFALAVFLAQRDEEAVQERQAQEKAAKAAAKESKRGEADRRSKGAAGKPHGDAAPRAAARVPRNARVQRAEALGPAAEPAGGGGAHHGERARVAERDVPQPPARGAAQLDLFGGSRGAARGR